MILTGRLPSPYRADDLWGAYLELPDRPHKALAGLMAEHLIATNPGMFALMLAEAGAAS